MKKYNQWSSNYRLLTWGDANCPEKFGHLFEMASACLKTCIATVSPYGSGRYRDTCLRVLGRELKALEREPGNQDFAIPCLGNLQDK